MQVKPQGGAVGNGDCPAVVGASLATVRLAAFFLGVAGQLSQVVLLRELLAVFHGNELSIGILLAAWLFWVGAGSIVAALFVKRVRRVGAFAVWTSVLLIPVLTAAVPLLRLWRVMLGVLPGELLSFVDCAAASAAVLSVPCFLLGAEFVFLARLCPMPAAQKGLSGGTATYILEAGGNIVGGALFSLLLVRVANPLQCLFLGAVPLAAATVFAAPGNCRRAAVGLCLALSVAAFPFLESLHRWAKVRQWRAVAPQSVLLETRSSRYGEIAVTEREGQLGFYQSGQLAFSTVGMGMDTPDLEEQDSAVFAHLVLTQHPRPRHVLLIGGGLRGVLREALNHDVESVDYVELDPVLIDTALRRIPVATRTALADPRVRVVAADGRWHLRASERRYDVIAVDVPDPATAVLNRYYTREFFRLARRRLLPGGILAIGAASTAGLREPSAANRNATIYHTLKSVFKRVLPLGGPSLLFVAGDEDDVLSPDPGVLRERYASRGVESVSFSGHLFYTLLQEAPLRRVNWILRHHGRKPGAAFTAPESGPLFPPPVQEQERAEAFLPPVVGRLFVNSDFRPIGYYYTLVFWNQRSGGRHAGLLTGLLRVRAWWMWPVLGVALIPALLLRAGGRRRLSRYGLGYALLFAVLTTGLSTMATQVALLFTFQSQYGYVYERVGLIVAVFMAGLAWGAFTTRRLATGGADVRLLAAVQALIALWSAVMAVALPASARVASANVLFVVLAAITFVAGFWNGMGFPLALACGRWLGFSSDASAGLAYGVELVGACLGAVLAGTIWAPVLGIAACCLLAGGLNAAACAGLLLGRPGRGGG